MIGIAGLSKSISRKAALHARDFILKPRELTDDKLIEAFDALFEITPDINNDDKTRLKKFLMGIRDEFNEITGWDDAKLARNWSTYLKFLWFICRDFEIVNAKCVKMKGIRNFTILPLFSHEAKSIRIDKVGLYCLLRQTAETSEDPEPWNNLAREVNTVQPQLRPTVEGREILKKAWRAVRIYFFVL